MDKLYKIKVLHGGPKSSHTSIETYLIANSDDQVMIWIDETYNNNCWKYCEEDGKMRCQDEPPYNAITMRDYVLQNCGDLDDEDGWDDAYYGVKKWGWEEIKVLTGEEKVVLLNLKIAEVYES